MIRIGVLGAVACLAFASGSHAEEARGCDKFKWPVERERAALTAPGIGMAQSGDARTASPDAFALGLVPAAQAKLPKPPERSLREPAAFAGYVSFAAVPKGSYQVTLSAAHWVDVIQGDAYLKPSGFSGAVDCAGVRKVVRFDLESGPVTLQVSGPADRIGVILAPVR